MSDPYRSSGPTRRRHRRRSGWPPLPAPEHAVDPTTGEWTDRRDDPDRDTEPLDDAARDVELIAGLIERGTAGSGVVQ